MGAAGAIGIGVGAPATVYAGQVWDEMEGEKNAAVAIGAGIAQATLDRVGLAGISSAFKGKGGKKLLEAGVEGRVNPPPKAPPAIAPAIIRSLSSVQLNSLSDP